MAKMTRDMKAERKDMLADFEAMGGVVYSNAEFGVTLAVAPAVPCDNPDFMRVAVAQCDFKDDTFKRKYGEWLALTRWYDASTLSIPTHGYKTVEDVTDEFIEIFED